MKMKTRYAELRKHQLDRDSRILFFLAGGVATIHQIRNIFTKSDGARTSRQACEFRMNQLVRMGYIEKHQFNRLRSIYTVYCLTELGRDIVTSNYLIERSHVRCIIPTERRLTHELVLSDIIRKVLQDGLDRKYDLAEVYDDTVMKSHMKPRKGIYYPDLVIRILRKLNGSLVLFLELDAGTKNQGYWLRKIGSWNVPTLVLTLQESRMKRLMEYVRLAGIKNPVGFSVANRFLHDGLANTEWHWLPDDFKSKLDLLDSHCGQ